MNTKRRLLAGAVAAACLGACSSNAQDASTVDLDEPQFYGDVSATDIVALAPERVTIYLNIDGHPNITWICANGLAFSTLSTTHSNLASPAIERVPEWDVDCPAGEGR